MKKILVLTLIFILSNSCKKTFEKNEVSISESVNEFAIVIHGGAGYQTTQNISIETDSLVRAKLTEAITVGYEILKNDGSSLDAVQKTINILEDSPLFNAGKGAVFTAEGINELDASIMDGKTLNAGASAGTTTVKNPINLARIIMEKSPHVLLSGRGAEQFGEEHGLELVEPSYFYTESRMKSLNRAKKSEQKTSENFIHLNPKINELKFGTVGCVALDKKGNIVAGTSTGGMTNKKWNRIGDSPIIGAGTYANNRTCGVSSTGHGEYFIRATVAHDISALIEYKNLSLTNATEEVIQNKLLELGGNGGVVAIDKIGNISMEFNTPGMFRASMNDKGDLFVGIYKNE